MDWGVGDGGDGEEEIYQTPVIDSQTTSAVPGPSEGALKKSETVGSFQDERSKGKNHVVLTDTWSYIVRLSMGRFYTNVPEFSPNKFYMA